MSTRKDVIDTAIEAVNRAMHEPDMGKRNELLAAVLEALEALR